jgi:phosphate transport system substrate-binding protein
LLLSLLAVLPPARAEPPGPPLVIQRELGAALIAAFDAPAAGAFSSAGGGVPCAPPVSATPRLIVAAGQPRPLDVEACRARSASDVLAVTIGYQVIALVTPAGAPSFAMPSADLFRALAEHVDEAAAPTTWRDVDPALPDLPIGVLAPPDGSVARRLFTTYVMEPACSGGPGASPPFGLGRRMAWCGAMRAAPGIVRRLGGGSEIAEWSASATPGQLAVVTLAELRGLGQAVLPLPLDGVLPTAANVEAGRYPAAERVVLLIVAPPDASRAVRDALGRAAFDLLSERSIGPEGSLARAGLMPMPAAERVSSRARAIDFLENP